MTPDLPTRQDILTAIERGVYEAFLHAMSASDGNQVPFFRQDMLAAIDNATRDAMETPA